MKTKSFLITVAILPALMMMAGCFDAPQQGRNWRQYPQNEQHIYVHYDDDPWDGVQKSLDRQNQAIDSFNRNTDQTMDNLDRSIQKMGRDNRDTFGILEDARRR